MLFKMTVGEAIMSQTEKYLNKKIPYKLSYPVKKKKKNIF